MPNIVLRTVGAILLAVVSADVAQCAETVQSDYKDQVRARQLPPAHSTSAVGRIAEQQEQTSPPFQIILQLCERGLRAPSRDSNNVVFSGVQSADAFVVQSGATTDELRKFEKHLGENVILTAIGCSKEPEGQAKAQITVQQHGPLPQSAWCRPPAHIEGNLCTHSADAASASTSPAPIRTIRVDTVFYVFGIKVSDGSTSGVFRHGSLCGLPTLKRGALTDGEVAAVVASMLGKSRPLPKESGAAFAARLAETFRRCNLTVSVSG